MICPKVHLDHRPALDSVEHWALGSAYMTVHQGANKCVSNVTTVDMYQNVHKAALGYCIVAQRATDDELPKPPQVTLNNHNISGVQKSIFQVNTTIFLYLAI